MESYWVKTSESKLIQNLLVNACAATKQSFEKLLQGKSVTRLLDKQIAIPDLQHSETAVWSMLLMSGYLNATQITYQRRLYQCELVFPNQEVKDLYYTVIQQWLSGGTAVTVSDHFITELLEENIEGFKEKLTRLIEQVVGIHDVLENRQENFYHGLLLGAATFIDAQQYDIESNKESGYGRFDIAIVPKNPQQIGIILELKSIPQKQYRSQGVLKRDAEQALQQIGERNYLATFNQRQVQRVLKIGIAFSGKQFQTAVLTTE